MSRKKRQKLKALKKTKPQKTQRSVHADERVKELMKLQGDADVLDVRENDTKIERFFKTRPRWKDVEVIKR